MSNTLDILESKNETMKIPEIIHFRVTTSSLAYCFLTRTIHFYPLEMCFKQSMQKPFLKVVSPRRQNFTTSVVSPPGVNPCFPSYAAQWFIMILGCSLMCCSSKGFLLSISWKILVPKLSVYKIKGEKKILTKIRENESISWVKLTSYLVRCNFFLPNNYRILFMFCLKILAMLEISQFICL